VKAASHTTVALHEPLYRGARSLRIALVGAPGAGRRTLFHAVQATSVRSAPLAGSRHAYEECAVQIGLDEARLVNLPSLRTLTNLGEDDRPTLKYLLWGDRPAPVSRHDRQGVPAPFGPPDVILQVVDATALERHLELTLELLALGRPTVIALNRIDEAGASGIYLSAKSLTRRLGVPVVPCSAVRGYGIAPLFRAALEAVRVRAAPQPRAQSAHLAKSLEPLADALRRADIENAFAVPAPFLVLQLAQGDRYFVDELRQHFPDRLREIEQLRADAGAALPRPLPEELHAERHHRAASLAETATRPERPEGTKGWRYWLDELLLSRRWSVLGCSAVFAGVLFVVFEVSAWIDGMTAARLANWISQWQAGSTAEVVARSVADGLVGLVGIVVPYMIPLVLLLVALEHSGVMARIAFAVDRGFHRIGLHGAVAVPFLLGLGCNVPAISSVARGARGRERAAAAMLIAFVPCSARSALVLALVGKYLGGLAVFGVFALALVLIALLGRLLKQGATTVEPGLLLEIPPYALPRPRAVLRETWLRTQDMLTIVLPLLVAGSIVLALLSHFGADAHINLALGPLTHGWLGLPVVLGMPILFGVLRKELSLLMLYQALGDFDVGRFLDPIQLLTLVVFLTFYVPCISTYAVMHRSLGRRVALESVLLSVGVALAVSGLVRLTLVAARLLVA
jgi:ferrous iron transport protein B